MKELHTIAALLGEENEQKIKDAITNLVIERVEDDLHDMYEYLLDWEEMFAEIKDEIKADIKEKVAKKYFEVANAKIDEMVAKL